MSESEDRIVTISGVIGALVGVLIGAIVGFEGAGVGGAIVGVILGVPIGGYLGILVIAGIILNLGNIFGFIVAVIFYGLIIWAIIALWGVGKS